MAKRIDIKDLNIYYGSFHAVADVALSVPPRSVTAFIGPSGCGKSTVLRTLNRMHEVMPGARVEGSGAARRRGHLRRRSRPGVSVRKTIGMVFQRPNPFPTMSIKDNVVAGLRLQGVRGKKTLDEVAERSLQGREPVERGQGPARQARWRPLRRSAAAAVHRPRDRRATRRAADGRAVLGARPDLHAGDRGSHRRTQAGLSRSSSSRTTCSRPPGSAIRPRSSTSRRRASRVGSSRSTTPRRSSPIRPRRRPRTTSPAASASRR